MPTPLDATRHALAVLACSLLWSCGRASEGGREDPGYVSSATCASCHPGELEAWSGSHHDLAMQVADGSTVLGDFDDTVFEKDGIETRFYKRAGAFFVHTAGPDGEAREFQVDYVFGVEPLQQLLVRFPNGRYQCLDVAWDALQGRWFSLYPDEARLPGDPFHWSGPYLRWNSMCAECHSTNLVKGYDPDTDSYATTWSEIDVACEACHGPGREHVAWAEGDGHEAGRSYGSALEVGLSVNLRRGEAQAQLNACAPCHSRRAQLDDTVAHGDPFLDGHAPRGLHEGLYHADGQILDEVYVYGSFVQSKMHAAGVACTDCHDPHSLDFIVPESGVCLQCHSQNAPLERFPDLQVKVYDSPSHHFHPPDSEGARCVNCHMPSRNYMVVDSRRDHSFRIPRPDLSVALGTPNACNDCHQERSAEWASEALAELYGKERGTQPHYGLILALGRSGAPGALEALSALASDPESPGIVRATALDLLANAGLQALEPIRAGLEDEDPLIRTAAAGAFDSLPPELAAALLAEALEDPVRSVRFAAARVLAAVSPEAIPAGLRDVFDAVLSEYESAQRAESDLPWANLNLALFYERRGDLNAAAESYERALGLDPEFLPAVFNLATLWNRLGRNTAAVQLLRKAAERVPGDGELQYSLGLALAEDGEETEAANALTRAAVLLSDRPRVRYNAGLALQAAGRMQEAQHHLEAAFRLNPRDPDPVHALVLLRLEQGDFPRARARLEELRRLVPNAPFLVELGRRLDEAEAQAQGR